MGMAKEIVKKEGGIKYPRVMVTKKRHGVLAKEAKNRKMSIQDIAEEKFLAAEGHVEK